ncbi:reverse transcriptase domain-containing protein [Streptosporangium sp. NPDC002544]|uniref:reverse transcriptase domain-containing protein n=1 Tax=Streptosporangium sp. NPDC002544 TaxID=3154538 RepID=UPI00331A3D17
MVSCARSAPPGPARRSPRSPFAKSLSQPPRSERPFRFEPRSYGLRPDRSCHDAIESIHQATSRKPAKRLWVLDADLAAAFDHIDHSRLLEASGSFPTRDMIRS